MKNNYDIRTMARSQGVKFWEIADALCIQDSAFSRMLRKELPQEEKEKILQIIDQLAKEAV